MAQLTEERRAYYEKAILDYEQFLARPHPEHFYSKPIKFPANFDPKRTNHTHILALIQDAKEQLEPNG